METPLQVFHDNHYLYIFAPDNDCRQRWVRAIKEGKQLQNNMVETMIAVQQIIVNP